VLDVGCGTGIVAALLAERGCRVLGVEPDERMAAVARSKGLDVEVAHFERWADAGRRFDLITAGQAWHWVAPEAGAAKAATVLRDRGRIALFWNFSCLPAPLRSEIEAVYTRLAPAIAGSTALGHYADRGDHAAEALGGSRDFEGAELRTFAWSRTYTTAEWIEQLPTHSDHQTMPEAQLRPLLDAVAETIDARGGAFEMTYQVVLVTARRRSRAGSDRAVGGG
jgi:SAM-dependent methyltransferase